MNAIVTLRAAAERDLRQIASYSRAQHGARIMAVYIGDIRAALKRLAEFPEIGAERGDVKGSPRCLACREHLIFYRYADGHVSVIRILHKAMDVGRWLQ